MLGTVGVVPPVISCIWSMLMFALCSLEPGSAEGFAAWMQCRPEMTSVHLLRTQDKLSQIPRIRDHSGETPDWLCRRGALARFIPSDS